MGISDGLRRTPKLKFADVLPVEVHYPWSDICTLHQTLSASSPTLLLLSLTSIHFLLPLFQPHTPLLNELIEKGVRKGMKRDPLDIPC